MYIKCAVAALTALGLWATQAQAQDLGGKVFRLGDLSSAAVEQEAEDTLLVRGFCGGGFRGGYYSSYRGSYCAGYRGSYCRPRVSFSYGFCSPSYYYSPPVYYYSPPVYRYYYFPCIGNTFSGMVGSYLQSAPQRPIEPMTRPQDESLPEAGNFPYDGGPMRPVPLPGSTPAPQKAAPVDPGQGRIVSLPARATKFAYPAYGEKVAAPSGFALDRPMPIKDDAFKAVRR